LELPAASAAKIEAALNLARDNGYRFVESYRGQSKTRRVFLFETLE
jgi:hypothetical protein